MKKNTITVTITVTATFNYHYHRHLTPQHHTRIVLSALPEYSFLLRTVKHDTTPPCPAKIASHSCFEVSQIRVV